MSTIPEAVAARIRAQKEHKDVLALWERLWAAYEKGGADEIERTLDELIQWPNGDEAEDRSDEEDT